MTNVVGDLLHEQLVVEVGTQESDGGRPRVQLRVNPDFGVVIGVDVGETGIRVEGFDLGLTEIAGATVDAHPKQHDAETVVRHVAAAVNELQSQFEQSGRRVLGVGVGVPGVVEHDPDISVHAPSIGWKAVPLARLLQAEVELPIFVENGAKTLGQAEMWLGAGKGARHAVVTLWGTGVGAAIFADGALLRGAASSAGEWGHTSLVVGGNLCRCGASGCLEAYIGAEALLRDWEGTDDLLSLPDEFDQVEWLNRLVDAAHSSEAGALVLDRTATYVGTATANLVNLFNPERVVLGGWVGLKLGPLLLPKIRAVVARQALDYAAGRVSVVLGQLGNDAVALGASTLVVEELLARGGHPPELPSERRGAVSIGS